MQHLSKLSSSLFFYKTPSSLAKIDGLKTENKEPSLSAKALNTIPEHFDEFHFDNMSRRFDTPQKALNYVNSAISTMNGSEFQDTIKLVAEQKVEFSVLSKGINTPLSPECQKKAAELVLSKTGTTPKQNLENGPSRVNFASATFG